MRFFWTVMVIGFVQPVMGQSLGTYAASPVPVVSDGLQKVAAPPNEHPGRAMVVTGWVLIGGGATLCVAGGAFLLVNASTEHTGSNNYRHSQSFSGIGEGLEIAGLSTMVTGAVLTIAGGMKHENKHRFGVIGSGNSMGVAYKF